jgi:hypothetical protein
MREIRLELSPQQRARMRAAQMGACFQCGRRCKQPLPNCGGGVSLIGAVASTMHSAAGTALRLLTLTWPGVTGMALLAFAYLSTTTN